MAFLLPILLFSFSHLVQPHSHPLTSTITDATSLLHFKNSLSSSLLLSDWNSSVHHCNWHGVSCDPLSARVVALNLAGPGLAGTLSPSLGNLSLLRILSLPHNFFGGGIPPELGNLRLLEILELQDNNFSEPIPDQLSHLSSLRFLNLSFNMFSGPMPEYLIGFRRLSFLDFSHNRFSGRIKLNRFGSCKSLTYVKLSDNFFTHNIPPEIGNCSNLNSFLVDGNILEGRIPDEIGLISELEVLDVSRNSLTDLIPKQLSNCSKLSVLILTNLVSDLISVDDGSFLSGGEYNAFAGGVPASLLLLPSLKVFWAPRANLGGRLPGDWNDSCSLWVLNLGQNYFNGEISASLVHCKSLTYLDLSSNSFLGSLPRQLQVPCMIYFNISRNSFTGFLPNFAEDSCSCSLVGVVSLDDEGGIAGLGNVISSLVGPSLGENFTVFHDFSWNKFVGSLPLFSLGDKFSKTTRKPYYRLLLNENMLNGSLPGTLFWDCNRLQGFSVNLTANRLFGQIFYQFLINCSELMDFEAAQNQIGGFLDPGIGTLVMLRLLDLRGNWISGSLPAQLGTLKNLQSILLGANNLTGEIPTQLSELTSLEVLDLSQNALMGIIPACLADASNLETVTLDHNRLSGEIPPSFSNFSRLSKFDVSFNNLSGHIPHLQKPMDCSFFRGNKFLHSCIESNSEPPTGILGYLGDQKGGGGKKLKTSTIALVTLAAIVFSILVGMVLVLVLGRRKLSRLTSLRRKVVVTFADSPSELNYDNAVRATGNFSIRNLIGTGGFGSTYKGELIPGVLIAVKRLSIGRFQGIQQFDAEIRTLGRIRHKNLVTLIGYYMGEGEMFLIYNYLSGGNLETFIHDRLDKNSEWRLLITEGRFDEIFSPESWGAGPKESLLGLLKLALTCTVETLSVRPSMKHAK
ncbi:Serine-threonine/tyrosine-protein kinase, catalytic domain, partial [Dillenia turbinata]